MMQAGRLLLCLSLGCCSVAVAQSDSSDKKGSLSGLDRRVPWTTSRLIGSPDSPPPYKVEPAFEHLTFDRPLAVTNNPAGDRLYVCEQRGKIFSFPNDPDCRQADLVADLTQRHPELSAIYGFTFHPQFARNRFVYVCYVLRNDREDGTRVVRFRMKETGHSPEGGPPQIDLDSEKVLITWLSGGHNGGCLKFGHDGYLYITSGDGAGPAPPDILRAGQDVTNLLSAILRIDVDAEEGDKPYRIPPDNPLIDVPGARPEIYSYGYRNPWKMSFDRETGDLWVGDVGWEQWEMIYRVEKGGNYGWSIMEGPQVVRPEGQRGPTPILPPTVEHPHSEAASITGGFVYYGTRLKELTGSYIYGDFQSGIVWAIRYDREKDEVQSVRRIAETPLQLVAFGEDNAGELYLLDHNRTQQIYRLIKNEEPDTSADFPRKLSETGLFTSLSNHSPAPGVIPYSIIAPQWADGTLAQRWIAVPGRAAVQVDKQGNWNFPDGSVLAKTVSIEFEQGIPESRQRLETQILHRENDSWRPYTYVWNDEQTDAELASAEGFNRKLKIADPEASGGLRERTYRFAARSECLLCHNPWVEARTTVFGVQSASPLAASTMQLNRDHDYGRLTANQLTTHEHIGLLTGNLPESPEAAERLVNPYDESAEINKRARSYLHVNCAHCHQFNAGGTANILLSYKVPLEKTVLLGERPVQGTFGISDAKIVNPGDPFGSVLYYRIAKLGGGRMPRAGSRMVDVRALDLFYDWITQLAPNEGPSPTAELHPEMTAALEQLQNATQPETRREAIERLTSSTRGALALLWWKDHRDLPKAVHQEIVALTKNHPRSEVRDLFERFVPESQRVKRLGNVINQAEILSLEADAARGEQVFFSDASGACKNCHQVNKKGKAVGPDLSEIGKKYPRDQLLRHILEPSRFIEPKYVSYLLETTEGRVHTGLLVEKTDAEVVLKDAQDKLIRVRQESVELLVPQQKSLMPDLLLRDMTRQQVADLLEYLSRLQ